ncbi:MAG: FadR/GntR family transcriptional regulator [Paracoccaceae bacterium]|nr:FadR/GntR family transcriptional regulator [Paracoccaceae bacterium]MDG1370489.1 FadR/GntR family transcriptional regulator [Paracoccaceae bacterium]MDG1972993.1 FadR/GntR family transcriptional regulator [Paracoccaceae bacterium]
MNAPAIKVKMGSAEIASAMRRDILQGELAQHDRLPAERLLAETYDVSRGTIREALNRLSREGLLEIRAGSGAYVTYSPKVIQDSPIDSARPLELMDTRFALEPHICRLAVLHARRSDFELFDSQLVKMEKSVEDPATFAETDNEFHAALARSTGNSLLIWIVTQMSNVRGHSEWTRMRTLTLNPKIISLYNTQHRKLIAAIKAREPERAANAMKEHLETARLSLTRAAAT